MKTSKVINTIENMAEQHSEAKIIDFKRYAEYNKKLSEIMETVNDLGADIHDSMFELACLDKGQSAHWNRNGCKRRNVA